MNYGNKSQKMLLAATLVTVFSIVSVVGIYAVLIGQFQGGEVTVGGVGASTVTYGLDNIEAGTWTATLAPSNDSTSWYTRLEISAGSYSGPVTIDWHLERKTGTDTWTDVSGATVSTSMVLSGSAQNVYATSNGAYSSGNHDWGTDVVTAGTYRVIATVESA